MSCVTRMFCVFGVLVALLGGCADDVPITVQEGNVTQSVATGGLDVSLPFDVIFVVDGSMSPEAVALRAGAARDVSELALDVQGSLHGRWNPVDGRAFIVKIGEHTVRSPADDLRLAWVEDNATVARANAFAEAIKDAFDSPSTTPDATNAVATLRLALGGLPRRENAKRFFVIVSAHDDPEAEPAVEPLLAVDNFSDTLGYRTSVCLLLQSDPSADERDSSYGSDLRIAGWARENGARSCLPWYPPWFESRRDPACGTHVIAKLPDGSPACRLRALLGTLSIYHLDRPRERGWQNCDRVVVPGDEYGDQEQTVCDIVKLTGDDARRCSDATDACEGCASGWCGATVPPGRCAEPGVRIVGGAAGQDARIEVACDYVP